MSLVGAVACSPISALDGIDYSKMLSTREDKTLINELTSGLKKKQKMEGEDELEEGENQVHHVSPMPKLNLSVLSDPQHQKSMR